MLNKKCLEHPNQISIGIPFTLPILLSSHTKIMNDFANDRFSEKGKDKQGITREQIISRHDMILKHDADIFASLAMPAPKRLQELCNNEYAFIQKYLQPRLKIPINDLDDYRILTDNNEIILIAVIKNLAYLCTISDENDQ
jgi:hypothetical protein